MKNEATASADMQKLLEEWECLDSTYKWNGTDYHGGWSETWEKKAVPILCHIHTLESQNRKMEEFLLKGSRTKIKTGDTEEEIVIFSAQDMDTLTL